MIWYGMVNNPYDFYINGCTHGGCSGEPLPTCDDCDNFPCVCDYINVFDPKYEFSSSMTNAQRIAIKHIIDSTGLYPIINSFSIKPVKIVINPNYPHLASYNPATNTLTFRNANNVPEDQLIEELFHAYQDRYYPGGTNQYVVNGKTSVEFEAEVFKDMMNGFNSPWNELDYTMAVDNDD